MNLVLQSRLAFTHCQRGCHLLKMDDIFLLYSLESRKPLIDAEKYSSHVHLCDFLIPPEVTFSAQTRPGASGRYVSSKHFPGTNRMTLLLKNQARKTSSPKPCGKVQTATSGWNCERRPQRGAPSADVLDPQGLLQCKLREGTGAMVFAARSPGLQALLGPWPLTS